jgi:hypothetical protein
MTKEDLIKHQGHSLEIERYGNDLCLECTTCGDTIINMTAPRMVEEETKACDMDGDCLSCGS